MSSNSQGPDKDRESKRAEEGALWSIFAYLLSGLIVWGGIGYGLDQWLDKNFFTLIGLLLGMGAALYLVWLRFGRK
ncbi:MAG: AtpZ/AtpI family protein [Actinobacteria bacterium]|jgi:ATP synthase protein I|nr:AtpZ/AtpI family protein [Actinomycetota bacterium]